MTTAMTGPMSFKATWTWTELPVHPAADELPMMSDPEISELASDIKANGLEMPILLWRDNRSDDQPVYLLDGRNRLAALRLLGDSVDPMQNCRAGKWTVDKYRVLNAITRTSDGEWEVDVDPYVFVRSINVRRRHLNAKQKAAAVKAYEKANPLASNREIAHNLGIDHHTVAKHRDEGAQNGEIPQFTQPFDRATAALLEDSSRSNYEIGKEVKASEGTVRNARKRLQEAGRGCTTATTGPLSKPRREPKPKPTFRERIQNALVGIVKQAKTKDQRKALADALRIALEELAERDKS